MVVKTIVYGILAIVSIISKFLWRAGVDSYETASGYGATVWRWKWTAVACVGLFGIGLAATEFQPEVMGGIDIAWETYAYPAFNRGNSYVLYSVSWFSGFSISRVNEGNLYIRQFIQNFAEEIKILVEAASIENTRSLMMDAYYSYEQHSETLRKASADYSQSYVTTPSAPSLIEKAMKLFWKARNTFLRLISDIFQWTIVSEDKDFCNYQSELTQECRVMTWALGPPPNCTANARDDWNDVNHVITDALDLITLGYFTSWFEGLGDALSTAGAAFFKRLVFLIQGVVDGCIPFARVKGYMEDWSGDLIGALNVLIDKITNGAVTDFADAVFSYLFTDVGRAVTVLQAISKCIKDYAARTDIGGYDKTVLILECIQVDSRTHDNIGLFAAIAENIIKQIGPPLQALDTCFSVDCGSQSAMDCFVTKVDCVAQDPATAKNVGAFFLPLSNVLHFLDQQINNIINTFNGLINGITNSFKDLQFAFNKLECCLRGVLKCSAVNPGCIIDNIGCIFRPFPCLNSFQPGDQLGAPQLNETHEVINGTQYFFDVLYNFENASDYMDMILNASDVSLKRNWTNLFPILDQTLDDIWLSISNSSIMNSTKRFTERSEMILEDYGIKNGIELNLRLGVGTSEYAGYNEEEEILSAVALKRSEGRIANRSPRYIKRLEAVSARIEITEALEDLANEISQHRKRGDTAVSAARLVKIYRNPEKYIHPAAIQTYRMYQRANYTKYRNAFDDLVGIAYRRYEIEYNVNYQKLHMAWSIFSGKLNSTNYVDWQLGVKGYLPSEGFVTMQRYNLVMAEADARQKESRKRNVFQDFSPREPRTISIFPMDEGPGDSTAKYVKHIGKKYAQRMADDSMAKPWGLGKSNRENFNEMILQFFDAVANFFVRLFYFLANMIITLVKSLRSNSDDVPTLKRPIVALTNAALDTVKYFESYDFEGKAIENTSRVLWRKWIKCEVPYNFDGTDQYNPIGCYTLFPENFMSWVKLGPNSYLPLQIPWPDDLITKDCKKIFNGNSDPLNYTASDNCKINDGQYKPLCPDSDYCDRSYAQCKDLGMSDFFDNIMYILGSMPWFANNAFKLGLPLKETCTYAVIITMAIVLIVSLPDLITTFPISVATVALKVIGSAFIVYVLFWTARLFWETISYSFILAVVFAMILAGYPKELAQFFAYFKFTPYIMMIGGLYLIVFIFWLIIPFPTLHFNPTRALANLITDIQQSWHFTLYKVDLKWLVDRIQRYDYSQAKPPHVDTFCFGWTFGNTAMAVIGPFGAVAGVHITGQFLLTCWIGVLELFQEISTTRLHSRMEQIETRVGNFRGQVNAYFKKKEVKNAETRAINQVVVDQFPAQTNLYRNPGRQMFHDD